ncbi:MAG: hypothetical protein AB7D07_13495 [Desulfovibrionaceae bacterium]
MFPLSYDVHHAGFVLPHGPYGSEDDRFLDFTGGGAMRFRKQRLGIYLASDLFTSSYNKASGAVSRKPLASMARGKRLYYTGEILDQWDLDVLMHCAMQSRLPPDASGQFKTSPAVMLRELGLRNDQRNRDRIYASLSRLHSGCLEIAGKRYTYMTRLLNRALLDRDRQLCLLEANADLVAAFQRGARSALDFRDRLTLGRNGMAKWLHGILLVFRGGFSANMTALRRLCGAERFTARAFAARTAKALELLSDARLVSGWEMDGDVVRVMASPAEPRRTACGYIARAADA